MIQASHTTWRRQADIFNFHRTGVTQHKVLTGRAGALTDPAQAQPHGSGLQAPRLNHTAALRPSKLSTTARVQSEAHDLRLSVETGDSSAWWSVSQSVNTTLLPTEHMVHTHTLFFFFKRGGISASFLSSGRVRTSGCCSFYPSLSPIFLLAQILMRTDLGDEPDSPRR